MPFTNCGTTTTRRPMRRPRLCCGRFPSRAEGWTMSEQQFPKGWDEERVKRLLADLDARTEEEWIAADEAAATDRGDQAVITVPLSLLPDIRRLLAAHKPSEPPEPGWLSARGGSPVTESNIRADV